MPPDPIIKWAFFFRHRRVKPGELYHDGPHDWTLAGIFDQHDDALLMARTYREQETCIQRVDIPRPADLDLKESD